MAQQILKLRRSSIPGKIPDTASLDFGELALNTYDGLAFMKKSGSNGEEIVTIGNTSGSFSGSFFGTASWANNSTSASYSISSSQAQNSITASYALSAISASFSTTSSYSQNAASSSYPFKVTGSTIYSYNSIVDNPSYDPKGTLTTNNIIMGVDAGWIRPFYIAEDSTIIGPLAAYGARNLTRAIIIGNYAGKSLGSALTDGVLIGTNAGYTVNNAGINMIAIGTNAAMNSDAQHGSVIIGSNAGNYASSNFARNVMIGDNAGYGTTLSAFEYVNYIGANAGKNSAHIKHSNLIGYSAGDGIRGTNFGVLKSYLTLIGYQAGKKVSGNGIGSNNIIIGTNITLENDRVNSINLGAIIFGTGSYSTDTGNPFSGSANGKIGINQPLPVVELDVSGAGRFTNGLQVTGSLGAPNITGSLFGTASWANNAITSSFSLTASNVQGGTANYVALWSGSTNLSSSAIYQSGNNIGIGTTAPNAKLDVNGNAIITGSLTVTNTITAQTLVVQTITSSIDYVTGSTRFGSQMSNTHTFTGSINVTGSLTVVGTGITSSLFGTASWASNSVSASNSISASYSITSSYAVSSSNSTSASYSISSSQAQNAISSSFSTTSSYSQNAESSSFAATASSLLGGTANYVALWSGSTNLSSSVMYQSGSSIGVGTVSPEVTFHVSGAVRGTAFENQRFSVGNGSSATILTGLGFDSGFITRDGSSVSFMAANSVSSQIKNTGSGSSNVANYAYYSVAEIGGTATGSSLTVAGGFFTSRRRYTDDISTNTSNTMYGINVSTTVEPPTTSSVYNGFVIGANVASTVNTGTTNILRNLSALGSIGSTNTSNPTTVNTYQGIRHAATIGSATGGATTVGVYYSMFLGAPTIGATATISSRWAIYSDDSISPSYIAGNLYIGNNSGSYKLDVSGSVRSTHNTYLATISGSVGIGTITPNAKLDVSGSAIITGSLIVTQGVTSSLFGTSSWSNNAITASYASNSNSSSYSVTSSYAISSSQSATSSYSSNFTVASQLIIDATLTDYSSIASSTVGANTLFSQVTSSYTSAFFKYTITSGSNTRAGEIVSAWNGATVQYYDNSTVDIGSTTSVTSSVSIVGSSVQFNVQTNTSGWRIKSLATFI